MSVCACGSASVEGASFCARCGARLDDAPQLAARKTVTILFCDVSGFTELGERLDPETLLDVMDPYFETMAGIIARHDGRVNKFIGDAIHATFGIPRLHEDDAVRAARCAVEMREVMKSLNT